MPPHRAPEGTTNDPKHGSHSGPFQELELKDSDLVGASLADEIAMMRAATRRAFELFTLHANPTNAPSEDQPQLKEILAALGALGLASIRTASLLRAQALMTGETNELAAAFQEAMNQVYKELNL
jgi:hypothetical protein